VRDASLPVQEYPVHVLTQRLYMDVGQGDRVLHQSKVTLGILKLKEEVEKRLTCLYLISYINIINKYLISIDKYL